MASENDIICLDSNEESEDEKIDTVLTDDNWHPKIEQVYTEVTANMEFPVDGTERNDPGETATSFLDDTGETATNFLDDPGETDTGESATSFLDDAGETATSFLDDPGETATNFLGISKGKSIKASLAPSSSLLPILPKSFHVKDNLASNTNIDTISISSMGDSENDFASNGEKTTFSNGSASSLFPFPRPNSFGQSPLGLNSFGQHPLARKVDEKGQGTNQSESVQDLRTVFASQTVKDELTFDYFSSEAPVNTSMQSDSHYDNEETNFHVKNINGTKNPLDENNIIKNKKFKKQIVKPLPNKTTTSTKDLKIKKLEEALEKCATEIKKLDETEVDLDDDEEQSAYVISSRYKERYLQIRQKIADIKRIPNELGRKSDKPFRFSESKYSIVNRKIEEFINSSKAFPNFKDICKVIKDVNIEGNLFMKSQLHAEAEKIFRKVGKKLKSRRLSDYDEALSSYLPQCSGSAADDPADKDSQLERKLQNNLEEGQKLINEYWGDVQEKREVEKHDLPASDHDESDSLDGYESDSVDNNSDEEEEGIGSENEADDTHFGNGSDSEKSEKEGKWMVIDKAEDKCLSSFENDATIDELLESDEEDNVIEVDDSKKSVSSRPEAMANYETTIKFGSNVKDSISWEEKDNCEAKTRMEVLPNAIDVMRTAEDSNASGMLDKINMEEHVEKGKNIFRENLSNEVIIIDD